VFSVNPVTDFDAGQEHFPDGDGPDASPGFSPPHRRRQQLMIVVVI